MNPEDRHSTSGITSIGTAESCTIRGRVREPVTATTFNGSSITGVSAERTGGAGCCGPGSAARAAGKIKMTSPSGSHRTPRDGNKLSRALSNVWSPLNARLLNCRTASGANVI